MEGATKQYGCDILISNNTYYKCGPEKLIARELDFIKVKGKNKPVSVYELVAVAEGEHAQPVPNEKLRIMQQLDRPTGWLATPSFLPLDELVQKIVFDAGS